MNEKTSLSAILATTPLPEGVKIRQMSQNIINIYPCGRDLTKADVTIVRAAIIDAGYAEVESWVAREGMNWLSDGIASVSIRVQEHPTSIKATTRE